MLATCTQWLSSQDISTWYLLVMTLIITIVLVIWHKADTDFHLQQVLIDSVTGKISIEKVGYMTALAIGTWGFVTLIQRDKMTEWFYMGYLSVFALSRVASSAISVTKDIKSQVTPPQ